MQASAKAVLKRYSDGDLTTQQLADCICAFYEDEISQENAACLSSVEREKNHWKKLGYLERGHFLAAIDPHGKAMTMIDLHGETVRRKARAINTAHECWPDSPELVAATEGESKWVNLASLVKAADGAPR